MANKSMVVSTMGKLPMFPTVRKLHFCFSFSLLPNYPFFYFPFSLSLFFFPSLSPLHTPIMRPFPHPQHHSLPSLSTLSQIIFNQMHMRFWHQKNIIVKTKKKGKYKWTEGYCLFVVSSGPLVVAFFL